VGGEGPARRIGLAHRAGGDVRGQRS
jgi:hypothetical protein